MKQITEQRPDLTYHCARRLHQQGTRGSSVSLYLSKLSRIVQLIGVLGSFTFVPSVTLFLLHFYTGRVLFNLDNFVSPSFSQYFSGSCHYDLNYSKKQIYRAPIDRFSQFTELKLKFLSNYQALILPRKRAGKSGSR